jgi:O-glycosyl hydrolase
MHKLQIFIVAAIALGISFTAYAQSSSPSASAKIHTTEIHQPIYGFGASLTYSGDALSTFANRDLVYKELYSDLGMDILRLRNYSGYDGQQDNFDRITKEFASGAIKYSTPDYRHGKMPVRFMFTSWSPPANLKSNNALSGRTPRGIMFTALMPIGG